MGEAAVEAAEVTTTITDICTMVTATTRDMDQVPSTEHGVDQSHGTIRNVTGVTEVTSDTIITKPA